MHETPISFSHVEFPEAGATLPEGRHRVRGWAWPKPGGIIVDVRARLGGAIFAGVHGNPRTDLAAHFRTGRTCALAEFHVVVDLLPGAIDIAIDALGIDGVWREMQVIPVQVTSAAPRAEVATPSGVLRWHEYGRVLRLLLRRQATKPGVPLEELVRELLADLPFPAELFQPPPPFRGHLDEPAAIARCRFGRLPVFGYLLHEHGTIRRVLATVDLQTWQTIAHTGNSPAPAGYFSALPQAARCGLAGFVDVPAQLPNPVTLRLYAELDDGSVHLVAVQRVRRIDDEEEKAAYADPTRHLFHVAHWRLLAAMKLAGIEMSEDAEFAREVSRIETEYNRASRVPAAPVPAAQSPLTSADAPLPRRVLLVTHNLDWEGAPLFLLDYALHLASRGVQLAVLSPADGPLRARFEAGGIPVQLTDVAPVLAAPTRERAETEVARLARTVDFSRFDLVVCNTFTTFWAVHAAKSAARPVLLYVHESTTPAAFYSDRVAPGVIGFAEDALPRADCVSFTTAATQRYHAGAVSAGRQRITPGWIDVARIDTWLAAHPREELRRRFALQPGELLVTNIGTVSDRKGQHIFARAVDLLWRRHPAIAARTRFVMLGGGATVFDDLLGDLLEQLGRANLVVHPASADYLPYYAAADLFVCSSYEESSPRVILEAMACGTPMISSAVHGVPELARPDSEAILVPPGDTHALGEALAATLAAPEDARRRAVAARQRVDRHFAAPMVLPQHAALAALVAGRR